MRKTKRNDSACPPFGRTIASYRHAAEMTQQELADTLQVSKNTVQGWEHDDFRPSVEIIPDLCAVLDMPITELFDMTGSDAHLSNDAVFLVSIYSRMSDRDKSILQKIAVTMLNE